MNAVAKLREREGWSQRDLAAIVGTSQAQVQRIERGQAVSLVLGLGLAAALDADPLVLFPSTRTVVERVKAARRASVTGARR